MSDEIGHHCGIALVRLKKPLGYYTEKYGSSLWGFNQLFLLMEKQHNRGQDGAGIGSMKLKMPAGEAFMFRERSTSSKALAKIFGGQQNLLREGNHFMNSQIPSRSISIMEVRSCWDIYAMALQEIMVRPLAILISERVIGPVRT